MGVAEKTQALPSLFKLYPSGQMMSPLPLLLLLLSPLLLPEAP
jgi:hypothetical protein